MDGDNQNYNWNIIGDYQEKRQENENITYIHVKNILKREGEKYHIKMLAEIDDDGEEWELVCDDIMAFGKNLLFHNLKSKYH